jgi:long-chain acyl-CoA synthetase
MATERPDRIALVSSDTRVSYGEVWERTRAIACRLADSGVRPGDRVMIAAPSTPAFACAYFGVHLARAVTVALDPKAPAARREELIERTQPALAIGVEESAPADTQHAVTVVDVDRLPAAAREFDAPALDSLADVMFTSGTTGRPKGVRLTQRNIAAAAAHINQVIGTSAGDVEVVPIPLYHSFGLGRLRCCLSVGATIVLVQGFRLPGEILGALRRESATGLVGVPAGMSVLLRLGDRGLGQFAHQLRYVEIGSAPMPLAQKLELMRLLPRSSLYMHYGLTEASRSAFTEFHRHREHLDTVGKPAPGVRIEARDKSGGVCAPGTAGALWIGGAHVSPGYWDDPGLSAENFVDGWTRTGDFGHMDADGFIHLHGREDDIVNVGGFKVAPDEVEQILAMHPAVAEVACIGVPDPRGIAGQVLRAYLVAADGPHASDAELVRWAAERLEPHKVPVQLEWIASLPRTESGKLVRAALRAAQPGTTVR